MFQGFYLPLRPYDFLHSKPNYSQKKRSILYLLFSLILAMKQLNMTEIWETY